MFSITEIIKATGGKLLRGSSRLAVDGISTDSRKVKQGDLFLALNGSHFNGHDFIVSAAKKGANALIIEEDYFKKNKDLLARLSGKISCIIVGETLRALGSLAQNVRNNFQLPIIAVTGSSGKTTTKEMIASVLSARFRVLKSEGTENNLIGVPLSLLKLRAHHQVACIEFGTSSFGEIERLTRITRPTLGVITNIGQSHLEKLKSKKIVFKEKTSLLTGLKSPSISLVNYDDALLLPLGNKFRNVFGFGKKAICDFFADAIFFNKDWLCFTLARSKQRFAIKTFGVHNIYNALAAIGVGLIFGISQGKIAKRLKTFKFPPSRFNIFKERGLAIIDDTYNANPLSLRCALESLRAIKKRKGMRKILVIADMLELGREAHRLHRQIGKLLASSDIDYILSRGGLANIAVLAALNYGFEREKIYCSENLGDLQHRLSSLVRCGDLILVKGSRAMHMERIVNFLREIKKG